MRSNFTDKWLPYATLWQLAPRPLPLWRNEAWRCRYTFGYSLDDSDKPVFLIWPERTEHNGFWLLDVETGHYHNLCQSPSIQNLGLEHFYAAFGLGCSRNLRTSSAYALHISEHTISEDCSVSMDIATQLQPLQHGIPCETQAKKRAKTTAQDMVIEPDVDEEVESSPNGSDSEASSSSQTASTANAEDVDTDLEELEDHYYSPLRRYSATIEPGRPRHCTPQELFAQPLSPYYLATCQAYVSHQKFEEANGDSTTGLLL